MPLAPKLKNSFQISIVGGGEGKCVAEMKVEKEHLNRGGGLHGGLSSTIVDAVIWFNSNLN